MRSRFARLSLGMASTTLLLLSSCSKKPEANLVPAGSPTAVLREALAKQYANLKLIGEIPKQPREMVVSARMKKHVQQEYAPPDMQYLRSFGYGLSQKQAQDLQKSEEAFVLQFSHPQENVWTGLRHSDALVEEIARNTNSLVWDEQTREVFTPDAWHERRLKSWSGDVPDISNQT